jgi:hypothetical protein
MRNLPPGKPDHQAKNYHNISLYSYMICYYNDTILSRCVMSKASQGYTANGMNAICSQMEQYKSEDDR